jgi:hypothetical protein
VSRGAPMRAFREVMSTNVRGPAPPGHVNAAKNCSIRDHCDVTDPCKTFALLIESPLFIEKEPARWKCDEEHVIIRHGLLTSRRCEGF